MRRLFCILTVLIATGCASQEMLRVRHMQIEDVDITHMPDGTFPGSFAYGGFDYAVLTVIQSHRILDIRVEKNRDTSHAKRAQAVIARIIEHQTPNVDAVSGATTTSKALMKAVENSLRPN